jgi:hypothetical protein
MTTETHNSYHEWLISFTRTPFGIGLRGWAFVLSVIPATYFLVVLGTNIYPPGKYMRLVLMLPGLIAAVVYIYLLGIIVYRASLNTVLVVCTFLAVGATFACFEITP